MIHSPVQSLVGTSNSWRIHQVNQRAALARTRNLCRASQYWDQGRIGRDVVPQEPGALVTGKSLPSSLRLLKKQHKRRSVSDSEGSVQSSIRKAFSSMVFMLRSMQRFTLEILLSEEKSQLQTVWSMVQREMHASFLWLFQQVFACTPKLMLSVMILLANFTVYSMDCSLALDTQTSTPSSPTSSLNVEVSSSFVTAPSLRPPSMSEVGVAEGQGGGKNNKVVNVAGGTYDDGTWNSAWHRKTMLRDEQRKSEDMTVSKFLASNAGPEKISIPRKVKESLVAPVNAKLEPDNYECFDRTDLLYQHALSLDCGNPMILANYAQFLYVVRHDHDRAEKLFRMAKEADPSDGESMSRLASFLWLAKGDKDGAEQAYKEAIASDPSNPFHAGDYANFMWHSGEDETDPSSQQM